MDAWKNANYNFINWNNGQEKAMNKLKPKLKLITMLYKVILM